LNLVLLFPEDFPPGQKTVRIEGRRFEHVKEVHRAAAGDDLAIGLAGGGIGTGRVLRIDERSLDLEVSFDGPPPPPLPLTLILALPRPKVLNRVIVSASSLGIKRIFLVNAWRVEPGFWDSPRLDPENLRRQMILGLEQSRDTILPEIQIRRRFRPFVEDELCLAVKGSLGVVAHPPAAEPCPRGVTGPVTLAVGPEGGFLPIEIETLERIGFRAVGLGERILRVETVIPFLAARLF